MEYHADHKKIDLYEIELQARAMRAEAAANGIRAIGRWIADRVSAVTHLGSRRAA